MKVLAINTGSSSIKYRLYDMAAGSEHAGGLLERIGEEKSRLVHRSADRVADIIVDDAVATHRTGFALIWQVLRDSGDLDGSGTLFGIGHRVVHGGAVFREPVVINTGVVDTIRSLIALAPLHNPVNLMCIEAAMEIAPDIPQTAVFDTAFHQSIGPEAFHYALPRRLSEAHGIRRYGFHGISHAFVAQKTAEFLKMPLARINLITLHLGNGASVAAIKNGRCMDTSMGMTPLEGLIMGTRGGDLDPGALLFVLRKMDADVDAVDDMLNRDSGLKGICGENDMREVMQMADAGNNDARLAVDMVVHRIKKYIGAYHAVIGGANAVVFTGGIGENAPDIRRQICEGLSHLGMRIDPQVNTVKPSDALSVNAPGSPVRILVVRTNEELAIAQQTVACIQSASK
ncbi:MAG: acetate kinase [Pseudomonadota bacterium]